MTRLLPLLGVSMLSALAACSSSVQLPTPQATLSPEDPSTLDALELEVSEPTAAELAETTGGGGLRGDSDAELGTEIRWELDGEPQPELDDSLSVPADATVKGQVWTAKVSFVGDDTQGPTTELSVTILNTPPEAVVTVEDTVPATDQDIVATASATDVDGDEATLSYTWTVDGAETAWDTDTIPASETAKGQVWEVTVVANDGEADSAPVTATASVANVAPDVLAVTLTPAEVFETSTVQAEVVWEDLDGDPVSLSYAWSVNGAVVLEGGDAWIDGALFDKGDTLSVTVTPNDGFVDGAPVSSETLTVQNSLPLLAAATIDPSTLVESSTASCLATGWADDDGDSEAYDTRWLVDGVEVSSAATADGALFSYGQEVVCELTPFDGEASGAPVQSAAVTVSNTPPVLASVTLSNTAPAEGETLSVTLGATSDDDGHSVSVSYAWYVDGALAGSDATLSSSSFGKGESVYVVVTPNDGIEDGTPVTSATATVVNTAPTLSGLSLSPSAPQTDDTLSASQTTADADGDAVSVTYAWTVDGVLQSETGATLDPSLSAKGQVVQVTATPNDGDTDGTASSASVTILNTPPSITSADLDGSSVDESSTLTCSASGWSDADGDAEGYSYSWTADGTEVSTSATITGADFSKGQSLVCTVTPDDGEDTGTALSTAAVVVDNSAPVLSGVTLSDTSPGEADTLTFTLGSSTDADGDAVSYTWRWLVNGVEVSTATTLTGSDFDKGDSIVVEVTPNDGTDDGATVYSATATVQNTPPSLISVSLDNSAPATNDTVSAVVSSSDADGDTVTYTYVWTVDGSVVAETGASLSGATYFDKDQVIAVTVTPNDGTDDGTTVSSTTATVVNTPPSAPTLVITPSDPDDSDALSCEIDSASSDADGDTVSYTATWTQNGSAFSSASTTTFSGDTVASTHTVDGDEWICTVVPNDGDDDGSSATASVDIVNWEGAREFTTCGATGYAGPSQSDCDSDYSGLTLEGEVTVSSGIQSWTVPTTGTYLIEAYGAQGASGDSSYVGGLGAYMSGEFSLTAGDVLYILVGQEGSGQSSGSNGGGGGGSFVVTSAGTPLLVAGGGGGTRTSVSDNGCDALTGEYGGEGSASGMTGLCTATGTVGDGGAVSGGSWGSGGGGFDGDGDADYTLGGGYAYVNGGLGGYNASGCGDTAVGGFGGGGSGQGCYGGGGGGGYSGGEGGRVAGGGGSYNAGSNQSNTAGVQSGDGEVVIDLQ